jgi:sucrose phosphorylase
VLLITETNVPHQDNLSYFGDGRNEAQLVYNFALPPLTLHAFRTGDATALSRWAAGLALPSERTAFFNFLASHDGIGLNPARGLIGETEIAALVVQAEAHGGRVSYKTNPDGSTSPYELNINYFDALSDPNGDEALSLQIDRFVAAHAIMFSLSGVPGLYFHSLFGSRSWPEGVTLLGHNRAINRQKFDRAEVERDLLDSASLRAQVFRRLKRLLQARSSSSAFDPPSPQRVIELHHAIFAIEHGPVLCLHNVSDQLQSVTLDQKWWHARDVLSARRAASDLTLQPYEVIWLTHD